MKKLFAVFVLAFASFSAFAFDFDVSVGGVYDRTLDKTDVQHKYGYRVEVTAPSQAWGVKPFVQVSYVDKAYTRYVAGGAFNLVKLGPVETYAVAGVGYQATWDAPKGYAFDFGLKAKMPVWKNVSLVGSAERFQGQDRIGFSNSNVFSVGVDVKL